MAPKPETRPAGEPDQPGLGWSHPRPATLPRPTYMPAVLAFGIVLAFWGLIASPILTAVGLLLGIIALVGWVGAIVHEQERDEANDG